MSDSGSAMSTSMRFRPVTDFETELSAGGSYHFRGTVNIIC